MKIDKKNIEILTILHKNCRVSLTEISRKVNLSVDSVNNRIKKMIASKIFAPTIILRHRYCGFGNVVEVKIKLRDLNEKEEHIRLINYLKAHPRITEVFTIAGEYDLSMVMIAKDAIDQGRITSGIRTKFGRLINAWSESLTITAHKFEDYDFRRLFGEENAED